MVSFAFNAHPWNVTWAPPVRNGWYWIPGHWAGHVWVPGYWQPSISAPVYSGVNYVYVPGWWQNDLYVEGYYRPSYRDDGDWIWMDGYYLEDGTYVSGHWAPTYLGPDGYVWEAGFFDGEEWIEGFWRPEYRSGFVWVSSWFDDDGIYHTGYWEPIQATQGQVWIPGWFDGNVWIEGYWVSENEYLNTNVRDWEPEEGWNDGWDTNENTFILPRDSAPLAVPIYEEEI